MALAPHDAFHQVSLKDNSGKQYVVDLRKARRFEIRHLCCDALYRFDEGLWVAQHTFHSGKTKYRALKSHDAVDVFLKAGIQPPDDLLPILEFPLPWHVLCRKDLVDFIREDEDQLALAIRIMQAKLMRLQNGMWVLFNSSDDSVFPSEPLSDEEALDLLLREGYPTAEYPLPDDLLELSESRRLGARQPTDPDPFFGDRAHAEKDLHKLTDQEPRAGDLLSDPTACQPAAEAQDPDPAVTTAHESVGTEPLPDGPVEPDGFRLDCAEVRFGRATLQRKLIVSLWDTKKRRPCPARPIQDVVDDVYGEEHDPTDEAFRQLCSDSRRKLEAANLPLTIEMKQGTVRLTRLSS
jgi:hypothetical protein